MAIEVEEDEVEEGAAWMATFADLSTLLLTFFILLLSFANTDVVEFRSALGSVREALGVKNHHPGQVMGLATSIVEFSTKESTANIEILEDVLVEKMKEVIKERGLEGEVEVDKGARGVVVRMDDKVLFSAGKARLRMRAASPLDAVSALAREIAVPLWIEGHTDNRAIKTAKFPSNWELSAARAAAVLRYMVQQGGIEKRRIRIAGYADTRPLGDNGTVQGRALNRRVEFLFVRPREKKAQVRLLKALEDTIKRNPAVKAGARDEAPAAKPGDEPEASKPGSEKARDAKDPAVRKRRGAKSGARKPLRAAPAPRGPAL